jgi:NADH-quinone oxidoreductase subunit F
MNSVLNTLKATGEQMLYASVPSIAVGMGTCGEGSGGDKLFVRFQEEIATRTLPITLRSVGCFGACSEEPLVVVASEGKPMVLHNQVTVDDVGAIIDAVMEGSYYAGRAYCKISEWDHYLHLHHYGEAFDELPEWNELDFFRSQKKLVLRNAGIIDPDSIAEYVAVGGYRSFEMILGGMSRSEVIQEIKDARLRGRGGAGFPTGLKWELMAREQSEEKYLICNADEGDPGAYMNRNEMESDPHSLIEGMLIASYATSAREGIIYVRAEYPLAVKRLKHAIEEAYAHKLLGKNILDSHFNFDLVVVEGAGAFVCGEETALIASLEGNAGRPRIKPPFPSKRGYLGKPTTINNMETWCNVPLIIGMGSAWFARIGTKLSPGTKVFSLVGKSRHTGLVELPLGEKLTTLVYEAGGGSSNPEKTIKAVQSGGPSGGCIPARLFDSSIDYESLGALGAIMGSGGMVVMDSDNCMVDSARYFLEFTTAESCGKCTPCREGLSQALAILDRICEGEGTERDIGLLEELSRHISDTALCGLGQSAMNPVSTTIKYFAQEYESHIKRRRCEAGTCETLVAELCSNSCPLTMRIPTYITLLKENRLVEAFTSTLEDNPLPGTLGRICHFHCQMRCRREEIDTPVHQGELHRYLADTLYKMGQEQEVYQRMIADMHPSTGKKIAIVGSGPAGLTAAFYLVRLGHEVTIYDEHPAAGGVLRYGIPAYRLPRDILDKELELFDLLGVKFSFNTTLGKDISVEELRASNDAVILALGSYHHANLFLEGSEGGGVIQGTEVLRRQAEGEELGVGKRAVVIGGGNVAIDVARSLWRLDREVTIAYRRGREEMPANRSEIEELFAEGISVVFDVSPKEVVRDAKGSVKALRVTCLEQGPFDISGRRRRTATDTEQDLACDTIIIAIGERVDRTLIEAEGLSVNDAGHLSVERYTYRTDLDGVWAIGDVITGPSTAAEAMGHAKEVAHLIDCRLTGEIRLHTLFTDFEYGQEIWDTAHEGRQIRAGMLPVDQRRSSFSEVNLGYTGRQARMEASRCLRCDICLEGEVSNA